LVVRDLDTIGDRVIPGTLNSFAVEFSPDGESLAFVRPVGAGATLVRRAITGGAEVELASWQTPGSGVVSWEADGTLLVGWYGEGIYRVSENGGEPELLVAVEASQNLGAPELLPGGEWVLFSLATLGQVNATTVEIVAQSLVTGERKRLRPGGFHARYVPTGHLVYLTNGTLFAVGFDPATLELAGTPVPLVPGVRDLGSVIISPYAVAADGTLVYVPGIGADRATLTLALGDGQGNEEELAMPAGAYANPRAAPDGRWIAYEAQYNDGTDIAVFEIGNTAAPRRLTFGGNNTRPAWSADGTRVAYSSARSDGPGLYWRLADGSGVEERLTQAAAGEIHVPEHFRPTARSWPSLSDAGYQRPLATRARDARIFPADRRGVACRVLTRRPLARVPGLRHRRQRGVRATVSPDRREVPAARARRQPPSGMVGRWAPALLHSRTGPPRARGSGDRARRRVWHARSADLRSAAGRRTWRRTPLRPHARRHRARHHAAGRRERGGS
jgi:hypothetical protein